MNTAKEINDLTLSQVKDSLRTHTEAIEDLLISKMKCCEHRLDMVNHITRFEHLINALMKKDLKGILKE